jgi:hypothetical protein
MAGSSILKMVQTGIQSAFLFSLLSTFERERFAGTHASRF